jgi:DNA-binding LacI/PurR family transcriptional regulator
MPPTIKDVAREAGVSIATVSYVLNNKNSFYSEATRQQVLEAIQRIGYIPNVSGRNLKVNQSRLIGYAAQHVLSGESSSAVMDQFSYYLALEAEAADYHVLIFTYPPDDPVPVYDSLIRAGQVDAFIVAGTIANDSRVRFLIDQGIPFASFGRANADWQFPWVDVDAVEGVSAAVDHLVKLGHTQIAMAAWNEGSLSGDARFEGYVQGLSRAGLPLRSEYVFRGRHSVQSGHSALAYWLTLPREAQPTAVIAVDDLLAIGVMNEAMERGIRVGDALAVVGFDDVPLSQYLRPALTTLRQPIQDVARLLIRILNVAITDSAQPPQQILVPPELIVRQSCGSKRVATGD